MSIQSIQKILQESGTRFPTAQCHETIGMHFVPLSEPPVGETFKSAKLEKQLLWMTPSSVWLSIALQPSSTLLLLNFFASPTDLHLFGLLPRLWCSQLLSSIPLTNFPERSFCLLYPTQGRIRILCWGSPLLKSSSLCQRFLHLVRLLNLACASYGICPEQSESRSVFLISSAFDFFILQPPSTS